MSTIVISANSSWNIINFRSGLIRGLAAAGYEVVVIAPRDRFSGQIGKLGARWVPISMDSSGLSPIADSALAAAYYKSLSRVRPSAFLPFTAKPNIYGGAAAGLLGIAAINNISGLGTAFMRGRLLRGLVETLYRFALRRSSTCFFQNADDRDLFVSRRIVAAEKAFLLPGSGVDLGRFRPECAERGQGPFRFLMSARLLWDKGVGEFVEAARKLRSEGADATFTLLGPTGVDNPAAISPEKVKQWEDEGLIEYRGSLDDVRPELARADAVVLPSYYREGVPRSLIEAAAMGQPIITTDQVGCRDAIEDGVTGFLCAPRSAPALAEAMRRMMAMTDGERADMSRAARQRAERLFDEQLIVKAYLEALDRSGVGTR